MIKKFITVLLCLTLFLFVPLKSFATSQINFKISDSECSINRLVTVDIIAKYSGLLCAATFDFTYDTNMFEFRQADTLNDRSQIFVNDSKKGNINTLFLDTDGIDTNSEVTIFSITLKAISSGTGYLDYSVSDCVSSEENHILIGDCTSSKINVLSTGTLGKADTKSSDSKSNSSSKSKTSNDSSKVNSSRDKAINNSTTSPQIDFTNIDSSYEHILLYFVCGGAFLAGITIIVLLAFKIGKNSSNKEKAKIPKSTDDNDKNE